MGSAGAGETGFADRVAVEGDGVGVEETESESDRAGMGVGAAEGRESSVGLIDNGGDLRGIV